MKTHKELAMKLGMEERNILLAGIGMGAGQGAPEGCQIVPGLFMKHPLAMASAPRAWLGGGRSQI